MARNWAITIGINDYRYLQPLNYAMPDADAVRQFFTSELEFHQVYHFTDVSPPILQDYGPDLNSQPTGTTLGRFLRTRFEEPFLRDGDNLWFFFAGHGIRYDNRDYLMPLDGDRDDLERSAIPLNYVSERLRRSGADNIIMLIDACRSYEGRRDGLGIGRDKQQGVITLFSCSPEESSYEIQELQQGAFTHVLLDSLRLQGEGNCATVERLYERLRHYVPQITRQYKRVSQTPYGVIEPPFKNHLILLPQQATLTDVVALKKDALTAELCRDPITAKQFWIRVLMVSPGDPEAIEGIERILMGNISPVAAPPSPSPPPIASATARATGSTAAIPTSPNPLTPIRPKPSQPPQQPVVEPAAEPVVEPSTPLRSAQEPIRRASQSPRQALPLAENVRSLLTLGDHGISRRRVLQILGFAGGSMSAILLGRAAIQSNSAPTKPRQITSQKDALTAADFNPITFETATVNEKGEIIESTIQKSQIFREKIGETTLDLMPIPGGTFMMGSPDGEGSDDEHPQHKVTISPFLMGSYEVTQAQWKAVTALPKVERDLEATPFNFTGDNLPVEQVSWNDVVEFCNRLSRHSGREYRLPSEAEWEYACRAKTTTPFYFGETLSFDVANYDASRTYGKGSEGEYRKTTVVVGSFPANTFGLYDMHGNVWEWCQDYFHDNYKGAPTDGSAWVTGEDPAARSLRGGSWSRNPNDCRSANRDWFARDEKYINLGFRVVCTAFWTLS